MSEQSSVPETTTPEVTTPTIMDPEDGLICAACGRGHHGLPCPHVKDSPPALPERIQVACDIATGKAEADPSESGTSITGAKKDLNCKGRGPQWYRMVWRNRSWRYVSDERLPGGSFLASDRRASVSGDVFTGEIVVSHDRSSPVDAAWLVCQPLDGMVLRVIPFSKRRDGQLAFTLPDGSVVVLPDPRKK